MFKKLDYRVSVGFKIKSIRETTLLVKVASKVNYIKISVVDSNTYNGIKVFYNDCSNKKTSN